MFDVWIGDVELTVVVLIVAICLVPLQALLCFKVKSLAIRLTPAILLFLALIACCAFWFTAEGWDGLGYTVLALLCANLLAGDGIGWAIWGIWRLVRRLTKKV